jgi:glycosyltransferase involved in cell wall biosynthesis
MSQTTLLKPPPRLRVAVVSGVEWRTPPRHTGTRELVAANLADGLVARGIDVTLFATADSLTTAKLRGICPRPLREDKALDSGVWNLLHLAEVFERAHEFDVIHCHNGVSALAYCELVDTPVVLTLHETPHARQLPIFHKYSRTASYVAVSDGGKLPGVPYATTIHPGVSLEDYRLNGLPGDYLLFVGSIAPKRGLERIIEAAEKTSVPLVIGGPVEDNEYFEKVIHPLAIKGSLVYLGPISTERSNEIFGRAMALVHLSDQSQPFRVSCVQAMACGTPVIALRSGSNLEIIEHRKSGFLVSTHEELIEAISLLPQLDRRKVRQRVLDHFSQTGMVVQYLRIYEAAIARAKERIRQEEAQLRGHRSAH